MDQEDNPILNIQLSDPEDQDLDPVKKKADRTGQTEDEFQSVKDVYRVRVENGNVSFLKIKNKQKKYHRHTDTPKKQNPIPANKKPDTTGEVLTTMVSCPLDV